ncbi:LysR substrate-binding domain-containing protein [Taibaiella koreensis]|uniref:LysR substrate-binding domain-containing protein n=1 Tax=Taibaiella koreensis TaxID=1268548 RepID=UPI000E59A3EE|nr:LysR substrate-binding domain-containing protein [Taibaiella koreensis]
MFDFRLKVFKVAAQRLSFTRAAEELFISQPAVSKHIHEIESHYKVRLFDRNGTRIGLTPAGRLLSDHVERLSRIYDDIDLEMAALSDDVGGMLRIGASTTVAQYYLPRYLASFKKKFPEVKVTLTVNNTETVEHLLGEGKIDMGIVEGESRRQHITYTSIAKDELVLCCRTGNPFVKKPVIRPEELKSLPFVMREAGSGSLDVVFRALRKNGINPSALTIALELQSTESIKSYLVHSDAFAFLSIHAILRELRENELQIIDIKGIDIDRSFFLVTPHGDVNRLRELFFRHIQS